MKNRIKRTFNIFLTLAVFLSLAGFMAACGSSKTVKSNSTWTVAEKTMVGKLTIEDGAVLNAPDGYLLTMTVNGVETPIRPGEYAGEVVITPTKRIGKALYNGKMTKGENIDYRAGLFIDAGRVVEESSVLSALVGGVYDGTSASGITITSENSFFNGIIINDTDYTVSNVKMTAKGPGGNDFLGYGAGIAVMGKSNAVIDNFNFTAVGPLRHGIYVGGKSEEDNLTVSVKNSFLKTDGSIGEIPSGAGMTGVPWVLGLETYAHVRTQMIAGFGNVTYENSTLLSDGWGVLSTDDVSVPKNYGDFAVNLYVKDSKVDFIGTSGYGTYAIGACRNIFDNTVMGNTEYSTTRYGLTYAMIVANEYAGGEFLNGTNVTAKYGVMYHKNQTGVTKVDASAFNTHGAVFLIKHCYPIINVSNSTLNSDTGVIVQLMSSDDPGLGKSYYSEVLDAAAIAKDEKHDIYKVNKVDTTIFTTQVKDVVSDAQVNFSGMEINGDFFNSVSGVDDDDLHLLGQNLVLSFNDVDLTGVISSATAVHRNYSFYFSKEKDADGNKIAVNADGYQIDGKWEAGRSMFGGGMPGGAAGGGMPEGGMGGSSMSFTPAMDADGNYVVIGDRKYDLYEGVIVSKNATYLGDLINIPSPAVNNGVIVTLTGGSVWTVTGSSYLTSLTVEEGSSIAAPEGNKVEMKVNGKKSEIKAGKTYTGDIVISLAK